MTHTLAFIATAKSSNSKTGPMPVVTSQRTTCPDTCPLKGKAGGCYAEGSHMGVMWSKLDASLPGETFAHGRASVKTIGFNALLDFIEHIPSGAIWRHNQAGDLPHNAGTIDETKVLAIAEANVNKRGFTYTHHDVETNATNAQTVATLNKRGFTVNLSANSPTHADKLAALGIAPVVTLLPEDAPRTLTTPTGRPVVMCPQVYTDGLTCKACGLCAVSGRKAIVGFPVHGAGKRKAAKAINMEGVA